MDYRRATSQDLAAVIDLSTAAFYQDPLYTLVKPYCKDEYSYRQFVSISQQAFLTFCLEQAICFVGIQNEQIVAFAILERPQEEKLHLWQYIKNGGWKLLGLLSPFKLLAYMNLLEGVMQPCEELGESCWYLAHLAIDPAFQGSGLGSQMLNECLLPFVKDHQPTLLSLVTHKKSNVAFYQRNGFKLFDHRKLAWENAGLDNWSLWLEG